MNARPALYRSTLIAAALAIGAFGTAAAQAHDHGWHAHDRGWHGRGDPPEWHEHGWYRPRYAYAAPGWSAGWVGYAPPAAYYPPPVAYVPLPPAAYYPPPVAVVPGGVSLVVRLPL